MKKSDRSPMRRCVLIGMAAVPIFFLTFVGYAIGYFSFPPGFCMEGIVYHRYHEDGVLPPSSAQDVDWCEWVPFEGESGPVFAFCRIYDSGESSMSVQTKYRAETLDIDVYVYSPGEIIGYISLKPVSLE